MRVKLTEKKIRSLAKPRTQIDILHERTPAAGLRLSPLGVKIWFYLYRSPVARDEKGQLKQRRVYLGYHPSGRRPERPAEGRRDLLPMTLAQFERAYDVFRGELAKGLDPQEIREVNPQAAQRLAPEAVPEPIRGVFPEGYRGGSFAALVADYFLYQALPNLRPRTLMSYKATAKTLAQVFGHRLPSEITSQDVRSYLTLVERRAPQSARSVRKVFSVVYEYGRSHWHLAVNPVQGVRITVRKGKRDRWLTDAELKTTLETLERLKNRKAADVYRVILYSMCRPGEAASVTAEDLIVLNGERVWCIRDSKNGRDFLIPLSGPLEELLTRRCREVGGSGPLFWPAKAAKEYPEPLKTANAEFRRLSGLEDVRPHDLRRTGRTHIASLGVTEAVAEALLNHVKGEIEGTYNLYDYWPERKAALSRWQEKLHRLESAARAA